MVNKVRMAIVTMVMSVDHCRRADRKRPSPASAPSRAASRSLADPSDRYFCRMQPEQESPQRAVSFLGLGHERRDLLAEMHRRCHQRLGEQIDEPAEHQRTNEEDEQRRRHRD